MVQICGLNVVQVDDLEEVNNYHQNKGCFDDFIVFMENGLGLECVHMGFCTTLGTLYAKYCPKRVMERLKLFVTCINIPNFTHICYEQQHWQEFTYLYIQYR